MKRVSWILAVLAAVAVRATAEAPIFAPYVIYPTAASAEAVAVGDLNGDGRNDVAVVTTEAYLNTPNEKSLLVFLQKADHSLAPAVVYPIGGFPTSVAIGDVNGDGRTDVVVATSSNVVSAIGVLTQNASGTLEPAVLYPTSNALRVKVADLNSDGRMDVVSIGFAPGNASVFLQQADGALAPQVMYEAPHMGNWSDLEVGDVNGDGRTDVLVGTGDSPRVVVVLYQQANGTLGGLTSRALGSDRYPNGVGLGDLNGDGRADVAVASHSEVPGEPYQLDVFTQQTDGVLPTAPTITRTIGYPELLEVGDVTGDGRADAVVAGGGWLGVLRQTPEGTLGFQESYSLPSVQHLYAHALAIGDINGDGANDVVVACQGWGLVVYRNLAGGAVPEVTDFNRDGKTDIVLQHTSGVVVSWIMAGDVIAEGRTILDKPVPGWTVRGSGDFNGDGQADLLIQSTTGAVGLWVMNGSTIARGLLIYPNALPGWVVRGAGDFDGDGDPDILLQNSAGAVVVWVMNGTTIQVSKYIYAQALPGWTIRGTGQFNGDTDRDIVLQHTSGVVVVWLMSDTTIQSGKTIYGQALPGWTVQGTGNFDSDNQTDIVLQNTNGAVEIWRMNGTDILETRFIRAAALPGWTVAAAK